jgi:hypothetical protein
MDTPHPYGQDDLNEIERRLSGWQPATEDLHPDAMLFAAGRAAGRRSRMPLLWPAACVFLALQAAGLGVWALNERAACQALARRLEQRGPEGRPPAETAAVKGSDFSYRPSPEDYLSLRHALEQDSSGWLSSPLPAGPLALASPPPRALILTPRASEGVLDH